MRKTICLILLALLAGGTAWAAKSPSQAYMEYHKALPGITTGDELLQYLSRERREELAKESKEALDNTIPLLKMIHPATVEITSETIQGDRAILKAKGNSWGEETVGTIEMRLDDDGWKVHKEDWTNP